MSNESRDPVRQVAEAIVESEKSYWKNARRLGLIGAGSGLVVGGGAGFNVLGVTGTGLIVGRLRARWWGCRARAVIHARMTRPDRNECYGVNSRR